MRIDLAAQVLLRRRQGLDRILELQFADEHEIHVAARALLAARDRTVDECGLDAAGEGSQRFAQHIGYAGRLLQDAAQLFVDWGIRIGLVMHLVALASAKQQPGFGKRSQLAIQGIRRSVRYAGDLADVVRLAGMEQQQRQHVAAVGAKEKVGQVQ